MLTRGNAVLRRILLVILLTVIAFLVAGCGEPDPIYLPALQADPMATYSHPDLDQEVQFATKKHTDWKGVERSADMYTLFVVDEDVDADTVVADILQAAEEAGWAVKSLEPDISTVPALAEDRRWRASKFIDEGLARLSVLLQPSYRTDGMEISFFLGYSEEDMATPLLGVDRGARYGHPSDLRDALEAIGVTCNLYTNQSSGRMSTCNEYVTLGVFGDREDTDAYVGQQRASAESPAEYVVGDNWVVEIDGDTGLGSYVSDQLGGERLATEDQR